MLRIPPVASELVELLIVQIDGTWIGIPTSDVKEVLRAARIAPSPVGTRKIKGLLNLRGNVVPVVAMRPLLGLAERDLASTDHFIVLQTASMTFALHVDRAVEIVTIATQATAPTAVPFIATVPHPTFKAVHICRADALWTQVGAADATSSAPDGQPRASGALP